MSPNALLPSMFLSKSYDEQSSVYIFFNCRVFRNGFLEKDELWVSGGKVVDPASVNFQADERVNCNGAIISPGFIDLQVNGAYGVDFLTHEDLKSGLDLVCERMPESGTTSFCPTLITSHPEAYHRTLPLLGQRNGSAVTGAGILGVHAEGPFISKEKKGAHPEECIVPLHGTFETVERMYGAENVKNISLITLAPENVDLEIIKMLRDHQIVVSLGHSVTDLETAQQAIQAGASKITHLFNAMHCFHHRNPSLPGLLVSELPENRELFFGLIADGVHTHPSALRIAHRMRQDGLILVTDAIAAMGLPPGEYKLGKTEVEVKKHPMRAVVKNSEDTLAGAIQPLDYCLRCFHSTTGCALEESLRSVTTHPAHCLGIQDRKGTLAFGSDADFVLLDDSLRVLATYIGGGLAYSCPKRMGRNAVYGNCPRHILPPYSESVSSLSTYSDAQASPIPSSPASSPISAHQGFSD